MKNKNILLACLILHLICTIGAFSLIADGNVRSNILRIVNAILYLAIAFAVLKVADEDEKNLIKSIPINIFLLIGVFQIGLSIFEYPNEPIPKLVYLIGLGIMVYLKVNRYWNTKTKLVPACTLITLVCTLIFLFNIYLPIFRSEVNIIDGLVYSVNKYAIWHWLLFFGFHFSYAIIEEVLYRSLLISVLQEVLRNDLVVVLSALIFSMVHLGRGNPALLVSTFVLGIMFGISYKKCDSLVPGLISHTTYNVLVELLVIYSLTQ